jgi:hypothetical protein
LRLQDIGNWFRYEFGKSRKPAEVRTTLGEAKGLVDAAPCKATLHHYYQRHYPERFAGALKAAQDREAKKPKATCRPMIAIYREVVKAAFTNESSEWQQSMLANRDAAHEQQRTEHQDQVDAHLNDAPTAKEYHA